MCHELTEQDFDFTKGTVNIDGKTVHFSMKLKGHSFRGFELENKHEMTNEFIDNAYRLIANFLYECAYGVDVVKCPF